MQLDSMFLSYDPRNLDLHLIYSTGPSQTRQLLPAVFFSKILRGIHRASRSLTVMAPPVAEDSVLIRPLVQVALKDSKLVRASAACNWALSRAARSASASTASSFLPQRIEESDGGVLDPCSRVRRVPAYSSWTGPRGAHLRTHRRAIRAMGASSSSRLSHPRSCSSPPKHASFAVELSHAGAAWIRRYLVIKGRNETADLVSVLWEKDWSAIPELCDDSFGKRILIYPPACVVTAWTSALEPSPSSPTPP
ncbi:hypothetical protein C8R46DRAFT_514969 [Mycena filopes]|nr:hypothetical protein C8R46DRAFT_514969 [Mycena filopes]